MDAVSIGAVTGGRDGHIMDHDPNAVVELQVALGAVSNYDARDCHIKTSIEPQSLLQAQK